MDRDPTKAPKPANLADQRPPAVSIPTRIVTDDVISDVLEEERPRFFADAGRCLELLAESDPALWAVLGEAETLEQTR